MEAALRDFYMEAYRALTAVEHFSTWTHNAHTIITAIKNIFELMFRLGVGVRWRDDGG
jgi:hypothetical protein